MLPSTTLKFPRLHRVWKGGHPPMHTGYQVLGCPSWQSKGERRNSNYFWHDTQWLSEQRHVKQDQRCREMCLMTLFLLLQLSPGLHKAVTILNQTTREPFEIPLENRLLREKAAKILSFHSIRRKSHFFSFMLWAWLTANQTAGVTCQCANIVIH